MKKIFCLLIAVMMIFTAGSYAFAAEEMQVVINGVPLVSDQAPIMRDDRVFVPIRAIAEALGATVTWNDDMMYYDVTIENEADGTEVQLSVEDSYKDARTCRINNIRSLVDTPPFIENSRTMVPVRLVSQALGCNVKWDSPSHTVYIDKIPFDYESHYESIKADTGKPLVYDAFTMQIGWCDYRLPALNINSEQAQYVSDQIEATVKPWIDEAIEAHADGYDSFFLGVAYHYTVYNDILSVVVGVYLDSDCDLYYSFNYDIAEDRQLTNDELLKRCGGDVAMIQNYCLRFYDLRYPVRDGDTVEERFYGSVQFYYKQREAAASDQCYNINSPLYLSEAGQLYAIANMPSLAGGSFYMYSIDTGLSMQ